MVGTGLKKIAAENGMQIIGGFACGSLGGFAASLSEGSGYKQIVFSTRLTDPAKKSWLEAQLGQVDLRRAYRVQALNIASRFILVNFLDNPGTMKKIPAFLDWFLPLLRAAGATGFDTCTECGCGLTAGCWIECNGIALYLHESCAQKLEREIAAENIQRREEDTGSYGLGAVGAFAGALLGSVVWALVLLAGYVASIVGLLIGWLADKGYDLLKGKQGKAKVVILILAVIFGVVIGTLGADVITLVGMIQGGELPGIAYGDIPSLILLMLATEGEYLTATISNIGMGLLFAALGVFFMLKQTAKKVSDTKFRYLNK